MPSPTNDILYPISLVLPHYTDTTRNALIADIGALIWNTSDGAINVCIAKAAAASSWSKVTSVTES
jgi:hypothetical protein